MLTVEEIKMFIDEDAASVKKHFARIGERYFDGDHDIKNYRMFYFNSDGQLVEDTSRANVRIPHPFFKELTEQGTQYTLSGSDGFVFSDVPELQSELDARFNNNDDFIDELSETLTDCQTKGFAYMYAMKDSTDKLKFTCADSIGVVEVEARFAEDKKDHVIYWYVDRVDKEGHRIKKIMDWDDEQVVYYVQTDEGEIQLDDKAKVNPRPHILYQVDGDDNTYIDSLGFLPFFRLDNNKKQFSNLKAVKDLIDDYDLMASSLSNNLIDFDHPLYAVKGFEGDNLDELRQNLKTKKIVGVGSDGFVFSDVPELQSELDARFNNNDDFIDELSETLTDCQTKGFAYMYAMKDSTDKLKFTCADSIGVVEVEARFAEDGKDHVIYWYVDRVDKEGHRIKKIMDWDDEQVVYYVQTDEGEIQLDDKAKVNPRPHILYQVDGDDNTYIDSLGFLPFFRLDNNKKQISNLKAVKDLIDDYDLMASSLSNNLIDFDHPLYAVKGFEGDNLDELQQNLKTKKIVGVGSDGGIEVHTVDVPYEARKVKLELDEKNIYRFGMGLNLSGLKDTSATTNIAIKAAYSLLDLRCKHLERNIKRFLRKIVAVCIDEINQQNGTDYQITDVYFEFTHEVMSNEQENEQNELTEAQKQQVQINTLLSLAQIFGDDLTIQYICDVLDIDYENVKDKLPDNEADKVQQVQDDLDSIIPDDEGGGIGEQGTEGSTTGTA